MSDAAQKLLPRRTFAIISHPDAGKTTLTEKFLLYGGQIQLAGSVTARKNQRATTSDWMEIEKQRGISISSTVLQFDYAGFRVNLLDTPGHKDFSEDTYRVLTAVDSAVMVIDAAKGIEPQTLKLFEVCRRRGVPIFTFMNKLDRPAKDPLELLDELERVLGIAPFPVNFPLGNGPTFRGVYDRLAKQVHLFERTKGGAHAAPVSVRGLDDPFVKNTLDNVGPDVYADAKERIDMLDGAGATFDPQAVLDEKITPVFFGSAMNNFGVQLLLDGFLKYTSGPTARTARALSVSGKVDAAQPTKTVQPDDPFFSGFVFKIQANMDPKHRDRVAFIRVVSGTFQRDMPAVLIPAAGGTDATAARKVRLSNAAKLFGQERETVDEAIAGDIVGIIGNDGLGIGDTLTEDRTVSFDEIPVFAPEVFAFLVNPQPSNFKRYRQGLEQLLQEGVVQALSRVPPPRGTGISGVVGSSGASGASTLLAAVGVLQFEVVQHRLVTEYQSETHLERAPWSIGMWMTPPPEWKPKDEDERFEPELPPSCAVFYDKFGRAMVLMADEWALRDFKGRNPKVQLSKSPGG